MGNYVNSSLGPTIGVLGKTTKTLGKTTKTLGKTTLTLGKLAALKGQVVFTLIKKQQAPLTPGRARQKINRTLTDLRVVRHELEKACVVLEDEVLRLSNMLTP